MKKTILLAAATMVLTATGAFAQAAMTPAPKGTAKSTPPSAEQSTLSDAQDMKADTSAAAKPKAHHRRMAKNEAALNAKEAETTKQLNQEQAQMASNSSGGMSSANSSGMDSSSSNSGNMSNDPNRPNSGMGRVRGANSGVEGRIGGSNSENPSP